MHMGRVNCVTAQVYYTNNALTFTTSVLLEVFGYFLSQSYICVQYISYISFPKVLKSVIFFEYMPCWLENYCVRQAI